MTFYVCRKIDLGTPFKMLSQDSRDLKLRGLITFTLRTNFFLIDNFVDDLMEL